MANPILRSGFEVAPDYGEKRKYFTVNFHYRGFISGNGYRHGDVVAFDWCSTDRMNLKMLEMMYQRVDREGFVRFFYKEPFVSDLKPLDSEPDVFEMCMKVDKDKVVDIFVNHFNDDDDLDAVLNQPSRDCFVKGSKVEKEEYFNELRRYFERVPTEVLLAKDLSEARLAGRKEAMKMTDDKISSLVESWHREYMELGEPSVTPSGIIEGANTVNEDVNYVNEDGMQAYHDSDEGDEEEEAEQVDEDERDEDNDHEEDEDNEGSKDNNGPDNDGGNNNGVEGDDGYEGDGDFDDNGGQNGDEDGRHDTEDVSQEGDGDFNENGGQNGDEDGRHDTEAVSHEGAANEQNYECFNDPDYNLSEEDEDFEENIIPRSENGIMGRPRKEARRPNAEQSVPTEYEFMSDSSDYPESDELYSADENSDGERRIIFPEFNEEKHMKNPVLLHGMKFRSLDQFKRACRSWSIKNRFLIHFPTNDKSRVLCKCMTQGCPYRLWASRISKNDPTVQIKTSNFNHTCGKVFKNFHMTSQWLACKYYDRIRDDPMWSLKGIIATVREDLGYTIGYIKAWRSKSIALKWIFGDERMQYLKLLDYRAELLQSNIGSSVHLWRDEGRFLGFYVCLGPLKNAFKAGCRPIVGVDGTWLKGNYGGFLFTAVGVDPNDCIFPIAYAVVMENESTETWSWFLHNLGEDLEIRNTQHIVWMSDRQKGLIAAIRDLFPNAEHRHCVRHMYQNFREKYKGKTLKDLLWNAARASYSVKFIEALKDIENEDTDARSWLDHPDRPHNSWTRSLFSTHPKCDILLNNMCECFNRYIKDARDKSIITMLEMIKSKLMKRMYKKKETMKKYNGKICPKVWKRLLKLKNDAAYLEADYSGGPKVEVHCQRSKFIVDMEAWQCTCRRWDLTGLPCVHALCAIVHNNGNVEDYVHKHYHVETFMKVYDHFIHPTNPIELWPRVEDGGEIIPPKPIKNKRGRKAKNRRLEPEEIEQARQIRGLNRRQKISRAGNVSMTCSICHLSGHNSRGHSKWIAKQNAVNNELQAITEIENQDQQEINHVYSQIFGDNLDTTAPCQDNQPTQESVVINESVVQSQLNTNENQPNQRKRKSGQIEGGDVVSRVSRRGRQVKSRYLQDYVIHAVKKTSRGKGTAK